jgi:hypothetical protein
MKRSASWVQRYVGRSCKWSLDDYAQEKKKKKKELANQRLPYCSITVGDKDKRYRILLHTRNGFNDCINCEGYSPSLLEAGRRHLVQGWGRHFKRHRI